MGSLWIGRRGVIGAIGAQVGARCVGRCRSHGVFPYNPAVCRQRRRINRCARVGAEESAQYACSLGRRRSGRRALPTFDADAGGGVACSKPAGVSLAGDRGARRDRWGGGAVGVAARWRTGTCVVGVVWRRHGGGAGCVVGARHDQPAVQLVARGLGRERHGVGDGEDRSDGGIADGGANAASNAGQLNGRTSVGGVFVGVLVRAVVARPQELSEQELFPHGSRIARRTQRR